MALYADVIRLHEIKAGRIDDIGARRLSGVRRSGTVTLLASHIPLSDGPGPDVIVHGMAAIAKGAGWPLHIVTRIERRPPVGTGGNPVRPPDAMRDVPLRREGKVVVAPFRKIALLPFAAIHESDVVPGEFHQRVWF